MPAIRLATPLEALHSATTTLITSVSVSALARVLGDRLQLLGDDVADLGRRGAEHVLDLALDVGRIGDEAVHGHRAR